MLLMPLRFYFSLYTTSLVIVSMPGTTDAAVCPLATALLPSAIIPGLMDSSLSAPQISWLRRRAQAITVTVWVDDRWSSGIVIHRQGQTYTVITNQHVVDAGQRLQVAMFDGRRYEAHFQNHPGFRSDDLALLQFQSSEAPYPVANFGSALSLVTGAPVFAAGFPVENEDGSKPRFHFTVGQVSLVSPKMLQGGYQVGYTNPVKKGMSGGPVLNRWGQVVAINGMHAYPLWGNPYVFMDGSKPDPVLQEVMQRSSWAIPVERFLKLAPAALKVKL